jgi:mannose-1-phosphate guanylyltransferase/mannose-6-phosphate isomerase
MMKMTEVDRIKIIASGKWRALVSHQISSMGLDGDFFIEEPEARNTAPAIALGTAKLRLAGADDSDVVLVCPSDHIIADEPKFAETVNKAVTAADEGNIVTFGIKPASPETGFGYIKTNRTQNDWLSVESFIEKPDEAAAKAYLESGNYFWNGGIFCFRISNIVEAYREHFPSGARIFDALPNDEDRCFRDSPVQSIDYAVMERAAGITCVPLDAKWSDVGSWNAVYENAPHDEGRNAASGNVSLEGGHDNLVIGGERLVCGIDLDSMIVVDTPDALLIAPRDSSQKLRGVVKKLSKSHHDEISEAPSSARPRGTYSVLSKSERHKIKRITVSPGGRLSLQYHLHRSEHWVVVQGTARVMIYPQGDVAAAERLVHEGESVFVPKGYLHRMDNPGKIPLVIIEVQIGEYVGEDDIRRIEDDYRRFG